METLSNPIAYGRVVSTALRFDEALERVREALKAEGFGILCDIDVKETMRGKLGVDFRNYRILGACNPQLAHRALGAEPHLGLLLPCNVVVQELNGRTLVSAIEARKMMELVGNGALEEIALEANARFNRALDSLSEDQARQR